MLRRSGSVLVAAVALLSTGCSGDNPREGGFFGGLAGLGSGAYRQRVKDQSAALQAEKVRYRDEVDGKEQLDGVFKERQSYAIDVEHELVMLRAEIDDLDADIAALEREETTTQRDVQQAEANVAALLDDINRIETERQALDRAEALGADAGPEADPAAFGEPPAEDVSDLRAYITRLQDAVDALKSARDQSIDGSATEVDGD